MDTPQKKEPGLPNAAALNSRPISPTAPTAAALGAKPESRTSKPASWLATRAPYSAAISAAEVRVPVNCP